MGIDIKIKMPDKEGTNELLDQPLAISNIIFITICKL